MSRVYVTHPVKEDLSAAEQYGEVIYVNHRYIHADELEADGAIPSEFRRKIDEAALAFDVTRDYLLLAGDHVQQVALSSAIRNYNYSSNFRVLRWDRQANGYFVVRV